MKPYSEDLRVRVVEARLSGETTAEVAERFGVCGAFVRRLLQRFRETGSLDPLPYPGRPGRRLDGRDDELREAVREHPDATPAELRDLLKLPVSAVTVWRAMRRLGLTRKKKSVRASEQDRPDIAEARRNWPDTVAGIDPDDLVFLDETGANTTMARTRGYAPLGERVTGSVPLGERRSITFVGGLTAGGLVAPWAFEGAMTGAWFRAYVEQLLVPALRPGMTVVMDNLACHKVAGVAEAIRGAGCRLEYLPPYSPDLNPIENAFSKLKRGLRDFAARTTAGVWNAMRELVKRFSPVECRNYFRHAGYQPATTG